MELKLHVKEQVFHLEMPLIAQLSFDSQIATIKSSIFAQLQLCQLQLFLRLNELRKSYPIIGYIPF